MKVVQSFGQGAQAAPLRVSLCDISPDMTDAWLDSFFGVAAVEIVQGDLLDAGGEAVVSPANSFGDMSGGVDKRIDDFYNGAAQETITQQIRARFMGELPVGMAMVVPLPHTRVPFVIAAQTMRVPEDVSKTLNAYLAMRAVLVAALQHNAQKEQILHVVAVPGLCTGVGRMSYAMAAQQMRAAYDNIIGGGWKDVQHPAMAPFAFGGKSISWRNPNQPN